LKEMRKKQPTVQNVKNPVNEIFSDGS